MTGRGSTLRDDTGILMPIDLPSPRYDHLSRMTGPFGLWEHARYTTPRIEHGYCTDDNARGLLVVSRQPGASARLLDMAGTYLRFLEEAALPDGGLHNRRGSDGSWLDVIGSDDSQGRAIWGLGTASRLGPVPTIRQTALELFERQLSFDSGSPRANAFAVLGAAEVLTGAPGHRPAQEAILRWLARIPIAGDSAWPWPEERLAYDNGRLPEALIAAGDVLGDDDLLGRGIEQLRWLAVIETGEGHFSFTPARGWVSGEPRPGFDQQPVEVAAMADACMRAWTSTGHGQWRDRILDAARWFMGSNDLGSVMYDSSTGGCYDGLTPTGPNLNQGAESTLAALSTLQLVNRVT